MSSRFSKAAADDDFFDDLINDVAGYQPSTFTRNQQRPQTSQQPPKKYEEVDDLLDFIDNTTSKVPSSQIKSQERPYSAFPTHQTPADDFLNDLGIVDDPIPVVPSRRTRPETALQPDTKSKMAELFGVKPKEEKVEEEIGTFDIGVSRRNRRTLTNNNNNNSGSNIVKKDDDSQNKVEVEQSVIDDYSEAPTKSRMRPPLNKKPTLATQKSSIRPNDSPNHSGIEVSPPNEIQQVFKSYDQIGGAERSFDKMSGINHQDDSLQPAHSLQPPPLLMKDKPLGDLSEPLKKQIAFLEQQVKDIRKEKEDQISSLNLMHAQQLENERKTRVEIVNQLQEMMEKERTRMLEHQREEIERVRRECDMDKQRALELIKHEPSAIKQQIEQQYKLNELADQLKSHTANLHLLQKQIEHNTAMSQSEREHQLSLREQTVVDLERKLQIDLNSIQEERLRIQHMYEDLKKRQQQLDDQQEVEKSALRSEFKRLGETQEQMRLMEAQQRKLISVEKEQLSIQKMEIDKQQSQLAQDYVQKLKSLDIEREAFELQKNQFNAYAQQNNELFKRKLQEIDEGQQRIAQKETELIAKARQTDLKEHEIEKMFSGLQRKLQLVDTERSELHRKMREITEKETQVRQDLNEIKEFRYGHQDQNQDIEKKRQELQAKDNQIQQEKLQLEQERHHLNLMHQTLSNMRGEIAQASVTNGFARTNPEMTRPLVLTANDFNKQKQPVIPAKTRPKADSLKTSNGFNNSSKFDVNSYVNYLKKVDQSTTQNQFYHIQQRIPSSKY